MDNDVIGSEECAALLRCTPEQVEELARAGDLPGLKIGRSWRFVKADLLAWLAQKAREEAASRKAKRQPIAAPTNTTRLRRNPPLPFLPQPSGKV